MRSNNVEVNSIDNRKSLYSKLWAIQIEIGSLIRNQENKGQKYNYFDEKQALLLLKPLLEKHKVALFFSDVIAARTSEERGNILIDVNNSTDLYFQKEGMMWFVKYLKKAELVNIQDEITPREVINNSINNSMVDYKVEEEKATYYFWAIGQNNDPAKAKGSAETYALKYFLRKFFLIPVFDVNDPDIDETETSPTVNDKITSELFKKN